jgi:hypothetical protein
VVPPQELPEVVGQGPDGKPSGSATAQKFFVNTVIPALTDPTKEFACSNCHTVGTLGAPAFLAGSPENAYKVFRDYNGGALAAFPERNLLLLKSQHEGPQLDGEQRGAVTEWLQLEYPGRATPPIEESLFDSLANFSQCMNRDEFINQGLNNIAITQLAAIAVDCTLCHNANVAIINGGGFVLDANADLTFDNAILFPGVMKFVTPTVSNTGVFQGLRESLRIIRKGNEFNLQGVTQCANEQAEVDDAAAGLAIDVDAADYCHPNYDIADDLEDQLQVFVANTRNRAKNQVCTDENNPM